jgi:hypothetical protein
MLSSICPAMSAKSNRKRWPNITGFAEFEQFIQLFGSISNSSDTMTNAEGLLDYDDFTIGPDIITI